MKSVKILEDPVAQVMKNLLIIGVVVFLVVIFLHVERMYFMMNKDMLIAKNRTISLIMFFLQDF